MSLITDFIPFALPDIGRAEEEAVLRVLRSGWLTTGDETLAFEREFACAVGSRHALAVNSATAGLHLALEAFGIGPGDLVATTPFTFAATAEVIRYLGAHPLFVDVAEDSFNLDPELLASAARKHRRKLKAVIPVHVGGELCDMDRIVPLCRDRKLVLIEDAAHAFPLPTSGGHAGTLGDAGVYSFYATKTITTGEGGMVVTEDDAAAKRIRIMRLHGIDRDIWDRYTSRKRSWEYEVVAPGFKYNLTDLAAAIGRVQLGRADEFLARRRQIAIRYFEGLSGCGFLELPTYREQHTWHLFMLRLRDDSLAIDRDRFLEELLARGVGTSVHYRPLHLMPYYRTTYGCRPDDFPRALDRYLRCFSIPIYPGMSDEQVERVIEAVRATGEVFHRPSGTARSAGAAHRSDEVIHRPAAGP